MNKHIINIGGKDFVADFGNATNYSFAKAMNMTAAELVTAINTSPIEYLFYALSNGARKNNSSIPWPSWLELSDHFDVNPEELKKAIQLIIDANDTEEDEEETEKKT